MTNLVKIDLVELDIIYHGFLMLKFIWMSWVLETPLNMKMKHLLKNKKAKTVEKRS